MAEGGAPGKDDLPGFGIRHQKDKDPNTHLREAAKKRFSEAFKIFVLLCLEGMQKKLEVSQPRILKRVRRRVTDSKVLIDMDGQFEVFRQMNEGDLTNAKKEFNIQEYLDSLNFFDSEPYARKMKLIPPLPKFTNDEFFDLTVRYNENIQQNERSCGQSDQQKESRLKETRFVYSLMKLSELDCNTMDQVKSMLRRELNSYPWNAWEAAKRDESGFTLLHTAAVCDAVKCAENASKLRPDVDIKGKYGLTPFMFSSMVGTGTIVEVLFHRGADWNLEDDFGRTSLHLATDWRNVHTGELLLILGMDPIRRYRETPLYRTALMGAYSYEMKKLIIKASIKYLFF